MIPRAHVTAWRASAPWPTDVQVEQDLVLSRALVELFSNARIAQWVAFRGGTALHKLFLDAPARYSEDIDLVQIDAGAIGPLIDTIRAVLGPWLGEPRRAQAHGSITLLYRSESTSRPTQPMRLKVEINTREHFSILGDHRRQFVVENPWFSGTADIHTYRPEELLATKLRALYQRRKGRDLYDLWLALTSLTLDDGQLVKCFERYLEESDTRISRAEFEANLTAKLESPAFLGDLAPLLPTGAQYDVAGTAELVRQRLISKLRGEPWKGVVK